MKKYYSIVIILAIALLFGASSCSKKVHRDDAVRIKPEAASKYNTHPKTKNLRSGNTLRGEVRRIQYEMFPDSCPITDNTKYTYKGYVVFVDSTVKKRNIVERIPLEDVDLVGLKINMEPNQHGNINFFETFNYPLLPRELREVPVDTLFRDTCSVPCPCEPISIELGSLPCIFCFKCPTRELNRWFFEIKPGYSIYNDFNTMGRKEGKDDWVFDFAAGIRFGSSKRWGVGVIASTGVETISLFDSSLSKRPSVNLYARYELIRERRRTSSIEQISDTLIEQMILYDTIRTKTHECCDDSVFVISRINPQYVIELKNLENIEETVERPCFSPFVYGLFGISIDKFSIDLFKVNFSDNCKERIDVEAPGVDLSLPINFGLGIGFDYPISANYDFSVDLGFRSISYADRMVTNGLLTPTNRRINSIVLRIGITY